MKTIAIFGDARFELGSVFQRQRADGRPLEIHDFTRSGCDASEGLWILRQNREILLECDDVVLAFGLRDWAFDWAEVADEPYTCHEADVPMSDFLAAYRRMIWEIKGAGAHPILLTLPELDGSRYLSRVARELDAEAILDFLGGDEEILSRWQEDYSNMICLLAAESRCRLIDLRKALAAKGDPARFLAPNGLTLNEAGREVLVEQIGALLAEKSLSKRVLTISSRMPGIAAAVQTI